MVQPCGSRAFHRRTDRPIRRFLWTRSVGAPLGAFGLVAASNGLWQRWTRWARPDTPRYHHGWLPLQEWRLLLRFRPLLSVEPAVASAANISGEHEHRRTLFGYVPR